MKKSALPPLPATSVFHRNNRKVSRDKAVMDAAAFFDILDAGGKHIKIIGAYGDVQTTNLRIRR